MSNRKKRADQTGRTRTIGARSPAERLEPGRAPARPRGLQAREPSRVVSGFVRVVSTLMTLALVGMIVVSGIGLAVYHQYESAGPLEAARRIVIPQGEGRIAIAERLEREGIITNRWTFVGGVLMQNLFGNKKRQELKAGEYELAQGASMRQVMETLSQGKSILYKVTIPEGLTSQQIIERLKSEASLSGEIAAVPAEGTLLPDTYLFSKGTSRQEIVERMQADMRTFVSDLWEKRSPDLPLRSLDDAVTFASIVEKETGQADERNRVAAVFYNRLKKGMRLQSDPTIIYGIVGGAGSLGRGITRADIDTKTAYNTYQINGLPPGPIANPGKQSLTSTFTPAKTNDLYFVADGTGGHAFSETLKDHNSAVQKWRESERQTKTKPLNTDDPNPDVTPIPSERTVNVTTEPVDDPAAQGAGAKLDAKSAAKAETGSKAQPSAKEPSAKEPSAKTTPTTINASTASIPLPVRKPKKPQPQASQQAAPAALPQ